jgi:hypothetical protein
MAPAPSAAVAGKEPSKWRLYLILGGIALFLVVVLWAVRNNQSAGDLAVGTCFDLPTRSSDITTVVRHDCTEAHDAEVYHVVEYTGASYPIVSFTRNSFVENSCFPVFQTYVGIDIDRADALNAGYFFPGSSGWDAGDRTFTCYAFRVDGAKLTKSVKGTRGT